MKLFRKLSEIFGVERDRTREPLFGLTSDQISELRDWRKSEAFAAYCALLDCTVTLYADGLLSSRDDATLHELRGMILGMRKSVSLVDEALRHADELDDAAKRKRESEQHADDPRVVALYGSPAYGRTAFK